MTKIYDFTIEAFCRYDFNMASMRGRISRFIAVSNDSSNFALLLRFPLIALWLTDFKREANAPIEVKTTATHGDMTRSRSQWRRCCLQC